MPALFFSGMTRAKTVAVYHCGEGRGQYGDFGMFPLHQVEQQQGGFKTPPTPAQYEIPPLIAFYEYHRKPSRYVGAGL